MRLPCLAALLTYVFATAHVLSAVTVKGTFHFEKVAVFDAVTGKIGLQTDPQHILAIPGSQIPVEVVASASGNVLGSSVTDDAGAFTITVNIGNATQVFVRALAEANNAAIVNAGTSNEYAVRGDDFALPPAGVVQRSLTATESNRGSGPFNILNEIKKANKLILGVDSGVLFPQITVNWSTTYSDGTYFSAEKDAAFINGDRTIDSDEFDDTVIVHEYGHFIAAKFSRDDSPGGPHYLGAKMDVRLAWSEGWANFFGCVCNSTSQYIDTNSAGGFSFDVSNDAVDQPGVWNELSVASTLWDIFDSKPANAPTVHLGAGFKNIWVTMRHLQGDQGFILYLVDFCGQYLSSVPATGKSIESILQNHNIKYKSNSAPPVDDPIPAQMKSGATLSGAVDCLSHPDANPPVVGGINLFSSSNFYSFSISADKVVTIDLVVANVPSGAKGDLTLYLYDSERNLVSSSENHIKVGGKQHISTNLVGGAYMVEVRGWRETAAGGTTVDAGSFTLTANF